MGLIPSGFFWILLACALYGGLHSVLASITVKNWAARRFGEINYQRYYRLVFVTIGVVTFLPLLVMLAVLPSERIYSIPGPWLALTLPLQAISALVAVMAVMQTGLLSFIGLRQPFTAPQPEHLVTSGLYRWVRHPIYTATFPVLWLAPVMTWNLLAFNLGLSAYMLIGTFFEERKLVQQFGQAYEAYRRRTPRILPGLKLT